MATPFTIFRRYSGIMMAFFGALLMLSFVVADPLMNYIRGGSSNGNGGTDGGKLAVSWQGGKLSESQLGQLVLHRRILAEFQQAVIQTGAREAYGAGVSPEDAYNLRVKPLFLPSTYEQGVEKNVVHTKLIAEAARKSGMVVTNDMITDYLLALGQDRVTKDQMRAFMSQFKTASGRTSIEFIYELLREALLYRNYSSSYTYSIATVLPQERWADWRKINDQRVFEAAPVPAADFMAEVPEPSEADLEALYAEFKDREPGPMRLPQLGNLELPSPEPAFAVPRKVVLNYVKVDFQKLLEEAETKITDEEIQKYYDENKEQFVRADSDLSSDGDSQEAEADKPEADEPAAEKTEETKPAAEPAKQGSARRNSPFHFVALQAAPATSEEPAKDVAIDAPPAEKPADDATDENTSTEANEKNAAEEEGDDAQNEDKKPAPVYQSLDEVKDQIRLRLAEAKAVEAMRELCEQAYNDLNSAYTDYFGAQLDAQDKGEAAPAPPAALTDLKATADKYGMVVEKTTTLSMIELQETVLGKSGCSAYTTSQRLADGQVYSIPQPLWVVLFGSEKVDLYQPVISSDNDDNGYVVLKTEDTPGSSPKLADIRAQVVEAWKKNKAAELALKKAEDLATAAQESGRTLKDYFASDAKVKVATTDPFSFLNATGTSPTTGALTLQLSNPEPLVAAGPELLTRAFAMKESDVIAGLNFSRDTAYVLRVNERVRTEEELRQSFLQDGDRWFSGLLSPMLADRHTAASNQVIGDLVRNAKIEWQRSADPANSSGN